MVRRTMFFHILRIELVSIIHPFPASKTVDSTCRTRVGHKGDIEEFPLHNFVRHEVIHLIHRKTQIKGLQQLVILDDAHMGHLLLLLYRKEQVLFLCIYAHHSVTFTQDLHSFSHIFCLSKTA